MITPQQAEAIIQAHTLRLSEEEVPLEHALHRIVAEDLIADFDLPPFDRVMMDGIAVRYAALENGERNFTVIGIQRAGAPQQSLPEGIHCMEVMTGAVCPAQADTVIPYEDIVIENGIAQIIQAPSSIGKNIHRRGSDKHTGDILLKSGARIGITEIGIAASIGKSRLRVKRNPSVLICSTGDELVDIDTTPQSHQIRRSNVHALRALVSAQGWPSDTLHLADEESQLKLKLSNALQQYDVILLSGGVSKGKFDLIPEVLAALGVQQHFHRIAQKPGKPMWFGSTAKTVVFAFPGNPVSTLACAARYLLPWIHSHQGLCLPQWVEVNEEVVSLEKLTQFAPVRYATDGHTIIRNQGSGDFSALSGACGFIEVPRGPDNDSTSSRFRFYPLP